MQINTSSAAASLLEPDKTAAAAKRDNDEKASMQARSHSKDKKHAHSKEKDKHVAASRGSLSDSRRRSSNSSRSEGSRNNSNRSSPKRIDKISINAQQLQKPEEIQAALLKRAESAVTSTSSTATLELKPHVLLVASNSNKTLEQPACAEVLAVNKQAELPLPLAIEKVDKIKVEPPQQATSTVTNKMSAQMTLANGYEKQALKVEGNAALTKIFKLERQPVAKEELTVKTRDDVARQLNLDLDSKVTIKQELPPAAVKPEPKVTLEKPLIAVPPPAAKPISSSSSHKSSSNHHHHASSSSSAARKNASGSGGGGGSSSSHHHHHKSSKHSSRDRDCSKCYKRSKIRRRSVGTQSMQPVPT